MATDEELLVINTLSDNWNEGNAALPKFYYDDSLKLHDFNNYDAIKVYILNIIEEPKGIGYVSYKNKIHVSIDIRSKSRDRMMNCRDEIKRIIRSFRKTLTGYDLFQKTSERKVASYVNFHQYVLEVELLKYITSI